ncbi:SDR family oxidoreductase [Solirubrobacter ginsenosidimutans]|uniref:SDR family oxidoreductase n=1 Tax=Solirubrobacter ginsenosidimutans TaxID=490573 RepID=A0A9X3RYZ1_9ACTN|nr:SDR family NAD(P)-dependent oxidoreductase [Solirubrobacter ginsenosidimutans]MDA0160320.1 SDR family oxidoreductase [Solirubrobacter ginsenosidimutans]
MASFDLTGRVALVTGGSRGLGRATVLAFAAAGADVVIASRKLDDCQAVAEEVEALGRKALPHACHVGRWNELDGLIATTYETFGRVDVLVNNAGMSPLYDRVENVSEELWRKVIDVNLSGPFRLTATIGARMAAGDGGSIINVSSVAARYPLPEVIPYAAAKAGLDALTVGFAHAFGPAVRVNSVQPGTFLTDVSKHWDMDAFERESQGFALQRGASADELEGTMLYLASDASTYTTGAVLRVDGGYLPPQRSGRS